MIFTKDIHYNYEIEAAVIGACLLEKNAFGRIFSILEKECFYHYGNELIYSTMKEMFITGLPIDLLTVVDQLVRIQGVSEIELTPTGYFVTKATNNVVSSAHLEYHASILKTMWMERELIHLTSSGLKSDGNVRDKIIELQTKIYSIQQQTSENDWVDMTALMVELYQHQEKMAAAGGVGIATGFPTIDTQNGGIQKGQMIVIGARPSMGKSALSGGMALHIAGQNKIVGIVSLEMSNAETAARLAAIDTNTDFNVLYRGLYKDEQETTKVYRRIANHTSELPIYVSDKTDVNVIEIKSKAEKLKSKHGLDCLIIDYLQLIGTGETRNKTRENEISQISRSCKIMAKELNIPVILLCQLNREVTKRKGNDRFPQLSDLRESGSIEQDADVVMFLHRDFMMGIEQDEQGASTEFSADLVIRKWRNGAANFIVPLDFDPPKMKFTEKGASFHIPSANTYFGDQDSNSPF